mgnify:CR=1 FL=1
MPQWKPADLLHINPDILCGTQAIADYLGVSVSTLYRMRRHHDLPIVTLSHHQIFATRAGLLGWFNMLIAKKLQKNLDNIQNPDAIQRLVVQFDRMTRHSDVS